MNVLKPHRHIEHIVIFVFSFLSCSLFAQVQIAHEFGFNAGGGFSALQSKLSIDGKQSSGFGGKIGLDYTFFFTPNWGIGTGTGIAFYNSTTSVDNINDHYLLETPTGFPANSNFYLYTTSKQIEEKQQATYFNIPLMLQYQTSGKNKFYAQGGILFGIPLSANYNTISGSLTTKGYSDFTGQYYETTSHGFSTFPDVASSGELDFGQSYSASMEIGLKWKLNDKFSLQTGLYLDYGLNKIRKQQSPQNFVTTSQKTSSGYDYNSLLFSQAAGKNITDKASLQTFGLNLKLCINTKSKQQTKTPNIVPTEITAPVVNHNEELVIQPVEKIEPIGELELLHQTYQQDLKELQTSIGNYGKEIADLNYLQRGLLDKKVEILKLYPEINIKIEGHICNAEKEESSPNLGLQRAEKAKEYLISKGILAVRIQTENMGVCCPITFEGNTDINCSKSRRIEIGVK